MSHIIMSRFKRYQTDKNIDHTRLVSALDFWGGGGSLRTFKMGT